MFLFEFTDPDPILVKLVATTSQLKSDIDNGREKPNWTVDELLSYYNDNGIVIGRDSLYDMVKNPPLNKTIANIQGDQVIFVGKEPPKPNEPSEDEKIVQQMAQNAMK
jgi:hypothetical protein